jgi:hypothetical protein
MSRRRDDYHGYYSYYPEHHESAFHRFLNKSVVKNLLVMGLCILFVVVLLFFPYYYYTSGNSTLNNKSKFQVGIHYVFEQDDLGKISAQVKRIHDLGFSVIRITLECVPDEPDNTMNKKNDEFFKATSHYGIDVALVIGNDDLSDQIDYYLDRWGNSLSYIQVMNEPELSSSWSVGSLFTDDELFSKFEAIYSEVTSHGLNVQLYTNFEAAYMVRSNVPLQLSKNLDFVGFDVYMDSFLVISPHLIQNLQKITHKDVVITEFGMSTRSSQDQSDFIVKGLDMFKNMGLKGCWLCYWNSDNDDYGIRGRATEQAVGDWIARNAV